MDNVRDVDIIFAIVDHEGRSKRKVENILTEFHKFVERKEDAVVVCTKTNLWNGFTAIIGPLQITS